MPIAVTIVGSRDRILEDRLRAAGMRPTSVATEALATLAHPSSAPPEVIVLDLRSQSEIPPILGPLKRQHPDTGLIIVATTLDPSLMLEAMRAGVTECVTEIGAISRQPSLVWSLSARRRSRVRSSFLLGPKAAWERPPPS